MSRLKSEKLAIPFTAVWVRVPVSVASGLPVPLVSTTVTSPANVVSVLPSPSCAATRTAGAMMLPAADPAGGPTNTKRFGTPGVRLNGALVADVSPLADAVSV